MTNIPNKYDPQEVEPRLQKFWGKNNTYKFDSEDTKREIYSIDTPPPTVSGKMHMGHAFGNSQQDFIARYKRMKGYNVLQPFGTDDNGLPTQTLIQKIKKVRAKDMPRKDFVKLCLKTLKEELRPEYVNDWKRLGISCDFNVSYTTINPHCTKVSQKSFLELYEMGRAYRKEAPAIWCPKCQTAIAQVELEDEEIDSHFNDIIFKIGKQDLIVATTRPELLPACVAIFYHPDDKRYNKLKGKMAKVPLFDFEVPILPDKKADPEKGTGIVMCCTFGDKNDVEWQKEHNLPIKTAITKWGKMSSLARKYENLKIKDARKEIIDDLKTNKLLTNQKEIKHAVNVHERCGTEIEYVHSKQWFIKYLDLKKDMLKWGKELDWHPQHMKNRYDNWAKGLSWDWCISRQIYFGIPFPVWYCEDCDEPIFAKEEDLPVDPLQDKAPVKSCPNCQSKKLRGESDIINTWATSSLTPTIVKELFRDKPVYKKLTKNPMDLRPQGHDIISFWLFNTVVKSQLHYQMKPWKHCFINGWMLDPKGKKMSKSKNNIIEPQEMIKKYSADALRYMSAGSTLGEDYPFQEKDLLTGKKTVTKLWNAAKFSMMHLENFNISEKIKVTETFDKWLLSKLNKLIEECTKHFDNYDFFKVKAEVDKFFWQILCDNYLEIVKDRLYNPDKRGVNERKSSQYALYHTLLTINKLFAPFLPFITEEIYLLFFKNNEKSESIHLTSWPIVNKKQINIETEEIADLGIDIIATIRKYKSEKQLSLKEEIEELILINDEDKEFENKIKQIQEDLQAVLNVKKIKFSGKTSLSSEKFTIKIGVE